MPQNTEEIVVDFDLKKIQNNEAAEEVKPKPKPKMASVAYERAGSVSPKAREEVEINAKRVCKQAAAAEAAAF